MSPKKIRVGGLYVNKGAGRTMRKVVDIILPEHESYRELCNFGKVSWYSSNDRPDDPIIVYVGISAIGNQLTNRPKQYLYLRSFAAWCGREVCYTDPGDLGGANDQG